MGDGPSATEARMAARALSQPMGSVTNQVWSCGDGSHIICKSMAFGEGKTLGVCVMRIAAAREGRLGRTLIPAIPDDAPYKRVLVYLDCTSFPLSDRAPSAFPAFLFSQFPSRLRRSQCQAFTRPQPVASHKKATTHPAHTEPSFARMEKNAAIHMETVQPRGSGQSLGSTEERNARNEYLLQRHGTLDLFPFPTSDPNDPCKLRTRRERQS